MIPDPNAAREHDRMNLTPLVKVLEALKLQCAKKMSEPVPHEITIPIYLTKDKLPEIYQTVIVSGGLAYWNGGVWCSRTGRDEDRTIMWEVLWWTPLLQDQDVLP